MAEESKKEESKCQHTECVINWLKVVDDVEVAGLKNKLPRMYWAAAALLMLYLFI